MRFHLALSGALLVAASATAQTGVGIGRPNSANLPGDIQLPAGSLNITSTLINQLGDDGTGMNDLRGVVRLPNGNYLVSQGQNGGAIKKYMEIQPDGTVVLTINQPYLNGANGDLGLTGIGWDQDTSPDSRIWGGRAKSMASYDWQAQAFDAIFNPTNPGVGLKVLTGFQGNSVRAATVAVINGEQIFVSADNEEADGTNYHRIGFPVADAPEWQPSTPSFNPQLGTYNFSGDTGRLGAGFNPVTETIWWHIDAAEFNPNPNHSGTRFFEMTMDGNATGKVFQGDRSIGGRAAGCDVYVDSSGDQVIAYLVNMGDARYNPLEVEGGNDVLVEVYAGFSFGTGCEGDISYLNEPYISSGEFSITLANAGSNPLGAAILFRGGVDTVGLQIPGINNCPLNVSLANFRNLGALPLNNGEASYVQNLPDDTNLIGVEVAYQWLLPTGLNVLPLNLSDPGAIRVGTNL
ncbi:MAG: hypothetical protein ACYTG5_12805 [Planctomycetota bacterium]|jgi:hypothetical protein